MKKYLLSFLLSMLIFCCCESGKKETTDALLQKKAVELTQKFILVDTHIDLPYRLKMFPEDISVRSDKGHFDFVRAIEGGLNVAFMSIYVPAENGLEGGAKALADSLIDMVEDITRQWPEKFILATSVSDVVAQFNYQRVSLPMGIENGSALEGSFENLKHFYNRGVRYITLCHSKSNDICDSSYDTDRKWNGLSPFGKELLLEMNKFGMMIDVSHITDSAFYQTIKLSAAPVIASHSSCRKFTPGFERNMSDEMLIALAKNGGVIQINFGSAFINQKVQKASFDFWEKLETNGIAWGSDEYNGLFLKLQEKSIVQDVDVEQVVDHIDHVVDLVGIDHVGFGSDFEGVDLLPKGLSDVSEYPNIIFHLLKRGYSEADIEKICSGNILRVWKEVEDFSKQTP